MPLFEGAVLLAHVGLCLAARTIAWPEITTPAYLWSRGMLLYRDVKFLHTPGTIGLLALAFRFFGPETWVVRGFALAGPLLAHADILQETRRLKPAPRILVSALFLASLMVSGGNAVWPTVLMAPLALPIARALSRKQWVRAGLMIGTAILLKQTAAYLLAVVVAVLLLRRHWRGAVTTLAASAVPYLAALGGFAIAGAGPEMLRWTLLVPFQVQEVTFTPNVFTAGMMVAAFLPTIAAWILTKEDRTPQVAWLFWVAMGFTLLCHPNFLLVQTVAALPPLAAGAGRLLEIAHSPLATVATGFLLVFTLARGVVFAAGEEFDRRVLFWNDDRDLNAVIERLRRLPSVTRVHSQLWGNVLPRSRLLPPGNVWVHPWLRWYFRIDQSRDRVLAAARKPGTVWVDYRSALPEGDPIGAYAIARVGPRGFQKE